MAKTDVSIRSRNYSVACAPGQEQRIADLAHELNLRIEGIASAAGDVGVERLLLLAGLALLDELDSVSKGGGFNHSIQEEAANILDGVADQLEALANRFERPD